MTHPLTSPVPPCTPGRRLFETNHMRIFQANLCLRFYTSAGWTREAVRMLLSDDKRLARVMPRYFDERDKAGQGSAELDDGLPHDDCEYFAVYGAMEPFAAAALAEHEIV